MTLVVIKLTESDALREPLEGERPPRSFPEAHPPTVSATLREYVGCPSERELKGWSICELEASWVVCSCAEISSFAPALKAEPEFSFGEAEPAERACSCRE